MSASPGEEQAAIDPQHPWLGLASFTEETRQYFYGREEEVAELARRVQRSQLTTLFGQSGLGKTSILRAGIVPRLRPEGYCPVYVRVDYAADAPSPSEQIKQAIFRATESTGQWSRPGAAVGGESLWEFLHHRDDVLQGADGKTVVPLLIFDQFEEIFTLAQADDAGRRRAQEFIEDLADLAENRPPKALEARLELDDTIMDRFDFGRSDYRILIALREDYLAHLESVKRVMPSITQNRMRLARMNGKQALAAVMKPGGALVSQEVAESIVRFVAGGSELPNAEVEPSLLSLICRELNNARIAKGKAEISADLLAGSHDTILAEFYERCLADQPASVRKIIEDELLTESGYRENLAQERLVKAFTAAGAAPDALATLVNRRLLRIEERLDVRRVELTHDVLCGVVRASRELRLEREARDEAEQRLAQQRDRERATRRALVRARRIALACAVLAIGAVISAVFGYQGMKRAQMAETEANAVRKVADASRGEAEKLVVYLLDDFYYELAPVGRLDAVGSLAKSAVAYYRGLPPELRTPSTLLHETQALVRLGGVLLAQGATDEAAKFIAGAEKIADQLREKDAGTMDAAVASALARGAQASLLGRRADFVGGAVAYREALEFLKPALQGASVPPQTRLLRLNLTVGLGFMQLRKSEPGARETLQGAQALARDLHALDLSNLPATEAYMSAGQFLADLGYFADGYTEPAVKSASDVASLADRVLEKRPDHRPAMRAKSVATNLMARIDYDEFRIKAALKRFLEQHAVLERLVMLDPSSVSAWVSLGGVKFVIANILLDLGRTDEALPWLDAFSALSGKFKVDGIAAQRLLGWNGTVAYWHQSLGNPAKAQASLAQMRRLAALAKSGATTDIFLDAEASAWSSAVLLLEGKHSQARELAGQAIRDVETGDPKGLPTRSYLRRVPLRVIYEASNAMGDYPAAEEAARRSLGASGDLKKGDTQLEIIQRAREQVALALALARQNKLPQAQALLQPLKTLYRDRRLVEAEDNEAQMRRATFLMAWGLAFPAERKALLQEAAAVFEQRPLSIRRMKEFELIGESIKRELAKP